MIIVKYMKNSIKIVFIKRVPCKLLNFRKLIISEYEEESIVYVHVL